ncbi:uncharacterized protein LOC107013379 [Solanum pennellii]|uniref:Uncharacterized protein LOC107013379 n=1 Tax=Solanum pennellii TaxID=28526 RepID=A0ABM1GBQ5_SOLPN|nr:uncharacterized protein LOC107013379 [Solanum pennellii]
MTPFEVVYGRPPPTVVRYLKDGTSNSVIATSLCQRDETLGVLKANSLHSQVRMKATADKSRREVSFAIGDWVYVRLRPYRQLSLRSQRHTKLNLRFFSPFQTVQRDGEVAYKLDISQYSKIYPVFHVSVLRKCLRSPSQQITPLELLDQSSSLILLPEYFI